MKQYILFTDEELDDLKNGEEIEHETSDGVIYFMSRDAYVGKVKPPSNEEWEKAINYLNMLMADYVALQGPGDFALKAVFIPLKKRLDNGERTRDLYNEIMECN